MPIPESEAFLAKKPTVPPTFDGVDYNDTPRLKAAQDSIIKEQWVKSMMNRLIRQELAKCYYREGVNHLEKCGKLRERYLDTLKDAKVQGYLFQQQNYIPGKDDPTGQDQVSQGADRVADGIMATVPEKVRKEKGDDRL
ncbi:MAG: hypothetical protein Q9186_006335 [Xanthomendoza sp. 1 TL-2023]